MLPLTAMPKLPVVAGALELLLLAELLLVAALLEELDEVLVADWLTELLLAALEPVAGSLLLEEESEPPQAVSTAVDSATIGRMICRYESIE